MRDRIIALAVIALALAALPRLRLDYAPDAAFPELAVALRLPDAIDSAEVTRRWVVPIESALRAAGDTTGTRGEVDAGAATIVARFKRGTDVELKAARLASDLAPLRARLPEHASLAVFPARGGVRPSIVVALSSNMSSNMSSNIADELRSTPGARDVQTFGTAREAIDVRGDVDARTIAAAILPHPIGKTVVAAPEVRRIGDLPLEVTERLEPPASVARLDGKPVTVASIFRDDDAPLLGFDRAVQRTLAGRGSVIWSDAAELRAILWRLAVAAIVATILCRSAYVPLAVALLVNVWSVTSIRVDAQTLAMATIAVAAIAPFAVLRARWPLVIGAMFAALLPLAAIFGTGALAPLLTPAARDFAVAACCALLAIALCGRARPRARGALVKKLLRNSASVVLASVATALFLLSWFGARLDPRRSEGSADRSHLFIRLQLPSGATLDQTVRAAASVESAIRGIDGVKRFWTSVSPASATLSIDVDPHARLLDTALRARLPSNAHIERPSSSAFAESVEAQPFADEDGAIYRFLLKGTDAGALRRTAVALATRIARADVPRSAIRSEWPEPSPRIELVPAPATPPEKAAAAASELARLTSPPEQRELPDGELLRVAPLDAPRGRDDVPRREDVFTRPLKAGVVTERAFEVRRASTEGTVTRELGRFVLPVDVSVRAQTREQAIAKRLEIDRAVALFPLPAGVIVERPALAAWSFSTAKLRLAAMAAFLPILLFTAAAIALASLARAAIALTPAVVAVAFVAPVLAAASARLDELTLLGTGAALCAVVALAVVVLLMGRTFRTIQTHAPAAMLTTVAGAALIAIAATAHPSIGDSWRAPLLAAATVVLIGTPSALFLPSAIGLARRDLRARRVVRPAAWRDASLVPHLAVRNVTKVYAGGFRALRRVSFELTPGVVGLLGPNGAGKTTLLRILTGLLQPTRGALAWCGVAVGRDNLAEFRRFIGFLPQEFNAYAGLTAAQFLDFWALERDIDSQRARRAQIEELLAIVGLEEHANRRVRDFSGGMRQRIGIARALLGNPPLLVVDEPTTGLDIEARRRFRDLLIALARNRIVIVSSHIASDVETTAMRLLLLARGELRYDGSVDGLLARARGRVFESVVSDTELRALAHEFRITTRVRTPHGIRVRGVVAEGQALPGAEAVASLEEAYLSEVSTGAIRRGSFAFVFSELR
jgi:ABC-2 type transport system ATP-binding protein